MNEGIECSKSADNFHSPPKSSIQSAEIQTEGDETHSHNRVFLASVREPAVASELKNTKKFLEPPKNKKAFLISPPSSPPVGWKQHLEDPPVVNQDLLAAISKMKPDEPCEIVKSAGENKPSIIVYPCGGVDNDSQS
jgi:hypothetical protein